MGQFLKSLQKVGKSGAVLKRPAKSRKKWRQKHIFNGKSHRLKVRKKWGSF